MLFAIIRSGDARGQHCPDPVAAPGAPLGNEGPAVLHHLGPGNRHATESLRHQAQHRVHAFVLGIDLHLRQFRKVIEIHARQHPVTVIVQLRDLGGSGVVLIGDLSDDLLQDVLDSHQAGRPAVLVHHDGDVHTRGLHVFQQLVRGLGVGNERGGPHE